MKLSLATLVALGAAATVASASLTASAVLYRGNTFTAENSRLLSRLFFRKENKGKQEFSGLKRGGGGGDGVDKGGRRALKEGRRNAAATTSAAAEIDPVLRRKAVPTAVRKTRETEKVKTQVTKTKMKIKMKIKMKMKMKI